MNLLSFLTERMAANIPPYDVERVYRQFFGRRVLRRYLNIAHDVIYDINFVHDEWDGLPLIEARDQMDRMWGDVLQHVIDEGAEPRDLIRIHISHEYLRHGDIIVSLRRIIDMTPDAIWHAIEKVLQSFQTLAFDNSLRISVGVLRLNHGGAHNGRKMINRKKDIQSKKCVVEITNTDTICMARALSVCEAYFLMQYIF